MKHGAAIRAGREIALEAVKQIWQAFPLVAEDLQADREIGWRP